MTTCTKAVVALSFLNDSKDGFDLVLSDVYMPDMNGFELLENIGLKMDLPVISKHFLFDSCLFRTFVGWINLIAQILK